jgi:outer membrane lipoprotein-sorting protein
VLAVTTLAGCAAPEVRRYRWVNEQTAVADLRKRAAALKTLSAEGAITLERPDGETVKFDGALVMQPPNRLRLRAWKFSHAVFDLTLNDDGLWVMTMDDPKRSAQLMPVSVQAADFVRELSLFTGGFFTQDPPPWTQHRGSDIVVFTRETKDGGTLNCEVERENLVPRRFYSRGPEGQRVELKMDEYRAYPGGVTWPDEIEAVSEMGSILIQMRNVEVNRELAPGAFVPPKRAEKRQ